MAVKFPKKVVIANPKLNIASNVLKIGTLAALLSYFLLARQYAVSLDVTSAITVLLWRNVEPKVLEEKVRFANTVSPFCTLPQDYDYWWDTSGRWEYTNQTCMPMCPLNSSSFRCLPLSEVAFQELFPPRVIITTHIMDTFLPREGLNLDIKDLPPKGNYFTMSADVVGVSFQFDFDMPLPGYLGLVSEASFYTGSSAPVDNRDQLTTMVVNSEGKLWKMFPPMPSIDLSVSQLLELSGHPTLMNETNRLAGENMMPGGRPGGPSNRISGLELEMIVECYSPHVAYPRNLPPEAHSLDGPVCVVRVVKRRRAWVTLYRDDVLDTGVRSRRYHGISIVVTTHGHFEVPDWNKIYLNLVSLIVMMALPEKLIFLITVTLLGHLSALYKRAVFEEFNVLTEVAGMTTRMITNSAVFVDLEDVEGVNGKPGGISKHRVAERIKRLLANESKLDALEAESMVRVCFHQMVTGRGSPEPEGLFQAIMERVRLELDLEPSTKHEVSFESDAIDLERFCRSCCSSERIPFDAVIDLFHRDRQTSFLERFFTPRNLWNEIHSAQEIDEEGPDQRCSSMSMTMEDLRDTSRKLHGEMLRAPSRENPSRNEEQDALLRALRGAEVRLRKLELQVMDMEERYSNSFSEVHASDGRVTDANHLLDRRIVRKEESTTHQVSTSAKALSEPPSPANVAEGALNRVSGMCTSSEAPSGSHDGESANALEGAVEGLASFMTQNVSLLGQMISKLQETTQQLHMEHASLSERMGALESLVAVQEQGRENPIPGERVSSPSLDSAGTSEGKASRRMVAGL